MIKKIGGEVKLKIRLILSSAVFHEWMVECGCPQSPERNILGDAASSIDKLSLLQQISQSVLPTRKLAISYKLQAYFDMNNNVSQLEKSELFWDSILSGNSFC